MADEGGDWFTDAGDDAPPPLPELKKSAPAASEAAAASESTPAETPAAPVQDKREVAEDEYLDPNKLLLFKHWIRYVCPIIIAIK